MRLALLVLLFAGCGNPTVIDGKNYAKSCTVASDCVGVFFGNQCQTCACVNAAISVSDKVTYEADRSDALVACGPRDAIGCAQCAERQPTCTMQVCGL